MRPVSIGGTDITQLTGADSASNDRLVIVDVSDTADFPTGKTKYIERDELIAKTSVFLQSGGGASATTVQFWMRSRPISLYADYDLSADGSTDDAAKILAALNDIRTAGGGIIECPIEKEILVSYGFDIPKEC